MIGEFKVFRNFRVGEDDFKPEYCCDFCASQFNSYLLRLPDTNKYVCKGCLSDMIEILNKAQVDNFQKDFEVARWGEGDTRDEQFGPMFMKNSGVESFKNTLQQDWKGMLRQC